MSSRVVAASMAARTKAFCASVNTNAAPPPPLLLLLLLLPLLLLGAAVASSLTAAKNA